MHQLVAVLDADPQRVGQLLAVQVLDQVELQDHAVAIIQARRAVLEQARQILG